MQIMLATWQKFTSNPQALFQMTDGQIWAAQWLMSTLTKPARVARRVVHPRERVLRKNSHVSDNIINVTIEV